MVAFMKINEAILGLAHEIRDKKLYRTACGTTAEYRASVLVSVFSGPWFRFYLQEGIHR
jgi:hypothetical protein